MSIASVVEQKIGGGVVGDVDVGGAIDIEIGDRNAQRFAACCSESANVRLLCKTAVALVDVAGVWPRWNFAWVADAIFALGIAAIQRVFRIVGHVIANVQIEQSVAVKVRKGCRGAPAIAIVGLAHWCDVAKRAIALVGKQRVFSDACEVDVFESIRIEIADRNALSVAVSAKASGLGDVAKAVVGTA